jgi:hypothetical protein
MLRFFAAFVLLLFFSNQKTAACGYDFVGDCSTSISLKINGSQDSFAVAPCPDVLRFDGFALGSLQTLTLARAKAATWESCHNNVSGMELWYRVYQQGSPSGSWQTLDLQEDYNTLVGPYTTRYRSANANVNLASGLVVGKTYVLEVFFRAEIDTVGDDFIPETILLQNNNGANYHFTFKYGGAAAPPFLVVPTKVVNVKCHGDSTGVAGVTVYGNQSGLFYQWSTGGNNFHILSEIPAGTYSVTATGAGGYSASDTIEITQPAPLASQFMTTSLGCDGSPGQAAAQVSGGTKPYYYEWQNGDQDSVAVFPESGDYELAASDANGCSAVFSVNIPAQPIVNVSLEASICAGETYLAGGTNFNETGDFEINLPGANGDCDTLVQLSLQVLPQPTLDIQFKAVEPFACSESDPVHLVIKVLTNAEAPSCEWVFNGQIISTADTCAFTLPVSGKIPDLKVTDENGCSSELAGINVAITQPLPLEAVPEITNPSGELNNGSIHLNVSGGVPLYSIVWDNGSTSTEITNLAPGTYCATVTDEHECSVTICAVLETSTLTDLFAESLLKISPNPVAPGQEAVLMLPENFTGQEVLLEILDLQGRALLRQTTQLDSKSLRLVIPDEQPDGTAFIRMIGAKGQNATSKLMVRRK